MQTTDLMKPIHSYQGHEVLQELARSDGFLDRLIGKGRDSLQVTRLNTKQVQQRTILDMELSLLGDKPVELPHCEGLSLHIGAVTAKGQTARVNMRVVHNPARGGAIAAVQGDVSLLLPRVGLIPVGTVPQHFTLVGRPKLTLAPDRAGLFANYSQFHVPLGSALLVIDDITNRLRVTPSIDVHGRIFRIGNTGVLVGFETMSFSCDGSKPRLDLHGGRIWQQADAS